MDLSYELRIIYTKINNLLNKQKSSFLNLSENNLTNVFKILRPKLLNYENKAVCMIILYFQLFYRYLQSTLNIESTSIILQQEINQVIKTNLTQRFSSIYEKINITIESDIWKRIPLDSCFNLVQIQNKILPDFITVRYLYDYMFDNFPILKKSEVIVLFRYLNNYSPNSEGANELNDELSKIEGFTKNFDLFKKDLREIVENLKFKGDLTILSSSGISILSIIVDLISDLLIYNQYMQTILNEIFKIIDYFISIGIMTFINSLEIDILFDKTIYNKEELKQKASRLESIFEVTLYQKQNRAIQNLLHQFKSTNYHKSSNTNYQSSSWNNNTPINLKKKYSSNKNIYSLLTETIIFYENTKSIVEISSILIFSIEKCSKSVTIDFIKSKINAYQDIISQLKHLLYCPKIANIIQMEYVKNKILTTNWISNKAFSIDANENSLFDELFYDIIEKYEKLDLLSAGSLTQQSKKNFIESVIYYVIEKLIEFFSKIKNCNSLGRSIMLKEIKCFKHKLSDYFEINLNQYFFPIELFTNAWYYSKNEMIDYIKQSNISLKSVKGMISSSEYFLSLNKEDQNSFLFEIEDVYLEMIN